MLGKHGSCQSLKSVLTNLDILAYQSFSEQQLQQKPSLQDGLDAVKPTLVTNQESKYQVIIEEPYSLGCDLQEFRKYGPGVYLSFKFMKFMIIVMLVLSPFPLANMIILITEEQHFVGILSLKQEPILKQYCRRQLYQVYIIGMML